MNLLCRNKLIYCVKTSESTVPKQVNLLCRNKLIYCVKTSESTVPKQVNLLCRKKLIYCAETNQSTVPKQVIYCTETQDTQSDPRIQNLSSLEVM
jgi:type II secretory pathway predicted ATPase ExeA